MPSPYRLAAVSHQSRAGRIALAQTVADALDHASGIPVRPPSEHAGPVVLHQLNDGIAQRVRLTEEPKRTVRHLVVTEAAGV